MSDRVNGLISRLRAWLIIKCQENSGHDLNDEQVRGRSAQAEPPSLEVIRHRLVRQFGELHAGDRQTFGEPVFDGRDHVERPFSDKSIRRDVDEEQPVLDLQWIARQRLLRVFRRTGKRLAR